MPETGLTVPEDESSPQRFIEALKKTGEGFQQIERILQYGQRPTITLVERHPPVPFPEQIYTDIQEGRTSPFDVISHWDTHPYSQGSNRTINYLATREEILKQLFLPGTEAIFSLPFQEIEALHEKQKAEETRRRVSGSYWGKLRNVTLTLPGEERSASFDMDI